VVAPLKCEERFPLEKGEMEMEVPASSLQNIKNIAGKKFLESNKITKINNSDKKKIAVIDNPAPIYRFFGQRPRKDRIK
jgi:hypothetical protein